MAHVVIVGGGFGGVKLAKLLAKENLRITLVDRHNFHLFQPLLYQVSTSVLSTDEIAYPIRSFFRNNKNVNFFMAKAEGVDQERDVLLTNHGEIHYDYLVLAAGSTTNFFGMKDVEEHAFGMKTIQEALHIRNHVLHEFERASKPYRTPEDRKKRLTFIVVGGGPTGVEEAGALTELIAIQKKEIHNLDFNDVSVKLIEATGRLLPMMPEDLQRKTVEVLQKKGVQVMLNTQVTGYDGNVLSLKSGVKIPSTTVIWAAGVCAPPFISNCGGSTIRDGRIKVQPNLLLDGAIHNNIFAIGDCAAFFPSPDSRPLPTVAPVATQQALIVHKNIIKLIGGAPILEKGGKMYMKKILAVIRKRDELLHAILMNATSKTISGDTIKITFDDELHAKVFIHNYLENFLRLAGEITGQKIAVEVITDVIRSRKKTACL